MSRQTAYCLALGLFAALVLLKFSPHTGFTSLIRFGESWSPQRHSSLQSLPIAIVPSSNGYDGQFYAQIALDPSLRDAELPKVIDAPAYRARRILLPGLAALLGMGNPWWVLQAYALLNVFAWLLFAWLLHRHIAGNDWIAYARWAGCVFSMGVLESVRQSLVDLPAILLVLLAVEARDRAQPARSSLWLMLGNLTKETSLLSAIALHGDLSGFRMRWYRILISLGACALPLALWSLYVHWRFPSSPGTSLGNFTWPLVGLVNHLRTCVSALLAGDLDGRYSIGLLAALGMILQVLVLWLTPQPKSAWWRVGAVYSALFLVLSPWVWSGYWAASRALLPMTIAFNLLLPTQRHFWLLWTLGNLTILHAVWRFL